MQGFIKDDEISLFCSQFMITCIHHVLNIGQDCNFVEWFRIMVYGMMILIAIIEDKF